MGKVGDDEFGRMVIDILRRADPSFINEMIVAKGEQTSYSIVLSIPGVDRIILHCPGANATFHPADLDPDRIARARIFHFGYPPHIRQMYVNGGQNLAELMEKIKRLGVATSLDMAMPDPDAESGRVDWIQLLQRTLPHVDLYLPSLEETLFMLKRPYYEELQRRAGEEGILPLVSEEVIRESAEQLLGMGCGMVGLKLGESGMLLRTGSRERLRQIGGSLIRDHEQWANRQLWTPCYETIVKGTTGAGDCTIAGFLAGMLKGLLPESTLRHAVAVGAFCVEAMDATSGVVSWEQVEGRARAKEKRLPLRQAPEGWSWDERLETWVGPLDKSFV
ncbi:carbohydrate kinase family protein [Brevibacillus choshinensis]|uniref:Carbohydrate kinase family protein n=1 Tax=Brevibacillus choshinensis TaxID=54911 RepID=A0ABX7FVJ1_BRECH|nr:PfkB family carbohydrate kinase [Brevibacillus choshinensis]QRG70243.1 carbohydrate kinase family protein [Brevibacillus choshinensis]